MTATRQQKLENLLQKARAMVEHWKMCSQQPCCANRLRFDAPTSEFIRPFYEAVKELDNLDWDNR